MTDTPRTQMLTDVLCAAIEGGTGYWAYVSDYRWMNTDPTQRGATLHDMEDDTKCVLTLENIELAIQEIVNSPNGKAWGNMRYVVREALSSNDASEIDADIADVIVQVACFGEVVYG